MKTEAEFHGGLFSKMESDKGTWYVPNIHDKNSKIPGNVVLGFEDDNGKFVLYEITTPYKTISPDGTSVLTNLKKI